MSRGAWGAGGLVAVVGLVALATAGCSSSPGSSSSSSSSVSGPSPSPSSSPSASATFVTGGPPTATASAVSPASSGPAVSPTGAASANTTGGGGGGTPGCATQSLQVKAGIAQGALGSTYQVIDFTNISSTACTLFGYPGVSLTAGSPPVQVGAAATRSTVAPASLVTLEPGQTANALLRITQALNYSAGTCSPTPTTALQIYPPNQTVPVLLPYSSTGCASTTVNLLSVGVVQPGSGSGSGG